MSTPRRWNVVLHRHEDASFTARVWVDGKLLCPDCVGCSAAAALAYIADALVDAYPGDELALRTQGCGDIDTCQPSDAVSAIRWLLAWMDTMDAGAHPGWANSIARPLLRDASTQRPDAKAS